MHKKRPFLLKMAVAVEQHHGLFKPIFVGRRPPLVRCKLQSYSQHGLHDNKNINNNYYYNMLEFSLPTSLNMTTNSSKVQATPPPFDFHRRSFSTPCLSLVDEEELHLLDAAAMTTSPNPTTRKVDIIYGNGAPKVRALIAEVAIAIASGVNLVPASGGLGGAYFLHARNGTGNAIAVVKPIDEEPLALHTSKGFVARMKPSIRVGETGLRELAAYLLDHGGFAGVPPTALVKISHILFHDNDNDNYNNKNTSERNYCSTTASPPPPYKIASLQHFVDHDSDAGDLGPCSFSVASVHRIGILDVRLLNLDRHSGNILVKKQCGHDESYAVGAAELVPIDHGLCLPEMLDDPYFEWLHWPQASVPFSDYEVDYISSLDPFNDAKLLRAELPSLRESSIRVLMLCTLFLKQAVAAGLCLADIGDMMTREFCGGRENLSVLENLCITAKINVMDIALSDDTSSNNTTYGGNKGREEEIEVFHFDDECDRDNSYNQTLNLNLPKFLETPVVKDNPLTIRRLTSVRSMSGLLDKTLSTLHDEEEDDDCDKDTISDRDGKNENDQEDDDNDHKVRALMKSMSFSVQNYNHENGGVSFGELSEEQWDLFVENFEKLLPKVFEQAKSMGVSKQRFGSSC